MSNFGQADRHSTDRNGDVGRVKVETGSTSLTLGRSFRAYKEFSLAAGAVETIQVVSPINFRLSDVILTVDSGEIRYESIGGATETSAFTPLPTIFNKNTRDDMIAPYTGVITAGTGGTFTGGAVLDVARLKTGTNSQRVSIVEQAQGVREVGPGTYYVTLTNSSGSSTATGIFYSHWEEWP
tara:strand:+ start:1551 stop:2096 length:546 start_codon:yes stop_codon:yes gene_type:complete